MQTAPAVPANPNATELFEQNQKLAVFVGRRFIRQRGIKGLDAESVLAAAQAGLWKAARRFDPARGRPFCVYAGWLIKAEILQTILPDRYQLPYGIVKSHDIKFTRLEMSPALMHDEHGNVIDEPEVAPSAEAIAVECEEAQADARFKCEKITADLPARTLAAMELYHGRGLTLEAIGQQLGISRERVRQLVKEGREYARARAEKLGVEAC